MRFFLPVFIAFSLFSEEIYESYLLEDEKSSDILHVERKKSFSDLFSELVVGFKGAYFHPDDKYMRKTYKGGLLATFELAYPIFSRLKLIGDVGLFSKRAKKGDLKTHIYFIPISLGLRYHILITENISLFFRGGGNGFYLKVKNRYNNLKNTVEKNGYGAVFGTGMDGKLRGGWLISIFFDYLYDKKSVYDKFFERRVAKNLGGWAIGGALGYHF